MDDDVSDEHDVDGAVEDEEKGVDVVEEGDLDRRDDGHHEDGHHHRNVPLPKKLAVRVDRAPEHRANAIDLSVHFRVPLGRRSVPAIDGR